MGFKKHLADLPGLVRIAVSAMDLSYKQFPILTALDSSLNGHRRTSFGEMALAGSLITGSHEGILKVQVVQVSKTELIINRAPVTTTLSIQHYQSCPTMSQHSIVSPIVPQSCERPFS